MRELRAAVLMVILFASGGTLRATPAPAGARQLAAATASALGGISRLAQSPKSGLDPARPQHAAFLATLLHLRTRLQTLLAAADQRGDDFLIDLDRGSSDLGALRVAWARAGVNNPGIAGQIHAASSSYRLLRAGYGREALRQRQGGTLSDAERRQLQRIQRDQRRFAASLGALREQARRRGDRVTAAELDRFRAEAQRIALAPASLESYLNSVIAAGELRGEWEADAPYVRQAAAPEQWAAADQAVEDLYVDSDIGQVFAIDLGKEGAAAEAASAVQVYQAGEGAELEAAATIFADDAAADDEDEDDEDGPVEGIEIPAVEEPAVEEPAAEEPTVEPVPAAAAVKPLETPLSPPPVDVEPPAPPPIG
jgi:hypothetical protein